MIVLFATAVKCKVLQHSSTEEWRNGCGIACKVISFRHEKDQGAVSQYNMNES